MSLVLVAATYCTIFDWRHAKRLRVPTSLPRWWLFALPKFHGRFVAVAFCSRPATHVRVGHTVTFSLAADRADFAVDLEVIKEKAAISSATAEVGLRSIQEKAAKPASSFAKQPTRKLQRSIARFRNADLEERLQMIEAAEGVLSDLLNAAVLDGDAILQVAMSLCWMASCTRLLRSEARSSRGCCKRGCHGFSA